MYESSNPTSPLYSPAESVLELPRDHAPTLRRCRTSSSLRVSGPSSSKITLVKAEPTLYLTVRHPPGPGAFTPTPSAAAALQFLTPRSGRRQRPPLSTSFSAPPSPERERTALSIPSISRAAPIDDLPRTPTSRALLDFEHPVLQRSLRARDSTPATLASVERLSRLCSNHMSCATCQTTGTNFPTCARCNQAWCSRACRLPNGRRHVCSKSTLSKSAL
ncbi:hypothetical protein FB45DRAFT_288606 [Roridomyces roridus]|uniref:HIT-type domain-containing protein n=1 Tax=Roridomyces roridus TaxID=1738132 RepID=A0AAD7CB43_9AGAR|nr:hypothetical protein FB45DRAFT_288606 [Roridomyces roridus]